MDWAAKTLKLLETGNGGMGLIGPVEKRSFLSTVWGGTNALVKQSFSADSGGRG